MAPGLTGKIVTKFTGTFNGVRLPRVVLCLELSIIARSSHADENEVIMEAKCPVAHGSNTH